MSLTGAGNHGNEEQEPKSYYKGTVKITAQGLRIPEKNASGDSFRDYFKDSSKRQAIVDFYKTNHTFQTYAFEFSKAKKMREDFIRLDKREMGIWECCELLNECVDVSDPDFDEPQIQHLLQTAEALRRDFPDQDWLHLTALIHDLGKVLMHPIFGSVPQWAVVGDTFPLGCSFSDSIVHYEYFAGNLDSKIPFFNTKLGIYRENCGLDGVTMSWGHDEYMYLYNNTTLPEAALFIIRFHSFYALHREEAYTYLMNDEDKEMLKWLHIFSKYDLYSKSKERINVEEVKPYYLSLIDKYFPTRVKW